MPQLIFLAAIGAGLYAGSKLLGAIASHLHTDAQMSATDPATSGDVLPKDLGQLEFDAATGVYKPVKTQ